MDPNHGYAAAAAADAARAPAAPDAVVVVVVAPPPPPQQWWATTGRSVIIKSAKVLGIACALAVMFGLPLFDMFYAHLQVPDQVWRHRGEANRRAASLVYDISAILVNGITVWWFYWVTYVNDTSHARIVVLRVVVAFGGFLAIVISYAADCTQYFSFIMPVSMAAVEFVIAIVYCLRLDCERC